MNTPVSKGPDRVAGPEEKPLPIIWAAFLVATLVYGLVGWIVAGSGRKPLNLELLHWIQIFLGMTSGLLVLTTFLLRQAIAALSGRKYRNYCVVRWAMLETIGIFGLVQTILGGKFEVMLIFVAVSLLSLSAARPGPSDRAAFLAQFD
jgi:hypothetical protein